MAPSRISMSLVHLRILRLGKAVLAIWFGDRQTEASQIGKFVIDGDAHVPAKALQPVSKLEARAWLSIGLTAWHKNKQKSRAWAVLVCACCCSFPLAVPVLSLPP